MSRLQITFILVGALVSAGSIHAQPASDFASGLHNPSKIILGPSRTLLVSEADSAANSGRVSIVNSSGIRRTLIEGLPSAATGETSDGPTGMVLDGDVLYVAIGEGDQLVAGTAQGTQIPNPKGPSSLILASLLQINFSPSVDSQTAPFTLKPADHVTLADGKSVVLDNGAGGKATVTLLSHFRYRPDAASIYRNSHPYGLTKLPGDNDHLYMTDAGLNSVERIDIKSGRATTLVRFPGVQNTGPTGPPFSDAVPDSVYPFGNRLLVTLLTGFPFNAGSSRIMSVDPASGNSEVLIPNLSSAIDVVWRNRFPGGVQVYVLEYSTNFLQGAPGRLRRFAGGPAETVVSDLASPVSMALDSTTGTLYIATRANGKIVKVDLAW
jgi:hypothetical protein